MRGQVLLFIWACIYLILRPYEVQMNCPYVLLCKTIELKKVCLYSASKLFFIRHLVEFLMIFPCFPGCSSYSDRQPWQIAVSSTWLPESALWSVGALWWLDCGEKYLLWICPALSEWLGPPTWLILRCQSGLPQHRQRSVLVPVQGGGVQQRPQHQSQL